MNHLGALPSELIALILNHVDYQDWNTCALINKPFYNQTVPLIWHQLDIHSDDTLKNIITTSLSSSSSVGQHIRSLNIHCKVSDTQLLTLIQYVPHLEHLILTKGDDISDTSFQYLPRQCPGLTSLWIHHANITTQVSIQALGRHCHNLTKLKFILCPRLFENDTHLFDALRECPLQEITLTFSRLSDSSSRIPKHHLHDPFVGLPNATHLTSLSIDHPTYDLTPLISNITTTNNNLWTWPRLTHLTLNTCRELQDAHLIPFIQSHPRLQYLELHQAFHLTDATLDAIATWLPNTIKGVSMNACVGITLAGICRLIQRCRVLDMGVTCSACDIYGDFDAYLPAGMYRTDPDYFDGPCQLSQVLGMAYYFMNQSSGGGGGGGL